MTPTDATFLLKRLEPAVRPSYFGPGNVRPSAPLEQQPFEDLLAAAKAGRLASGRSVSAALESGEADFRPLYPDEMGLVEKLETVAREIYGADRLDIDPKAATEIAVLEDAGLRDAPVCIA